MFLTVALLGKVVLFEYSCYFTIYWRLSCLQNILVTIDILAIYFLSMSRYEMEPEYHAEFKFYCSTVSTYAFSSTLLL